MRRHDHTTIFVLVIALLVLVESPSRATVVRVVRFDEKVEGAAAIVLGKCIESESRWTGDGRRILTHHRFMVEKTFKGLPAQEIVIVLPGGTIGNIRQVTIGVPEPKIGRDYVLFLRNTQAGPTIHFLEQGLYEVRSNARGEREVIPPWPQAVFMDQQTGTAIPAEQVMTLPRFEDQVRETIRRREAMRMEMIKKEKPESSSLLAQVKRNKTLVFLALLAIVLSIWMLVRR
jgi:hypothetical protein